MASCSLTSDAALPGNSNPKVNKEPVMSIRRPSLGTVLGVVSLVVAMSGTAVAVTTAQSGDSLIIQRTLSGNRLRLDTVTGSEVKESSLGTVPKATLAQTLPKLVWHDLTLTNGWIPASARTPGWAIDAQGLVHLRGEIGNHTSVGQAIATIPAPGAPQETIYLTSIAQGWTHGSVTITATGQMFAEDNQGGQAAAAFTSLDGLTYSPN